MDEIEQRLRESADHCFKCYEAWRKNEKDAPIREALQDAVHELRKVASRVEIELAVSERKEMAQRPIAIPPHRDARGRHQTPPGGEEGDDLGNASDQRPEVSRAAPRRRGTPLRRSLGGSSQGGPRTGNNDGGDNSQS
ncbi:MAG: hypothetical protein IT559_04990 [Alphaproteobacteria bacterium]|nr:hypothetical protein [Alphaproteobacteria bacterium]